MKKLLRPVVFILTVSLIWSCSDSVSDEFEEINGNVAQKFLKSIAVTSAQDFNENLKVELAYNSNGTLNTISNGTDSSIFIYKKDKLSTITGPGNNLNMEELYGSPYNAFETGQVQEYDDNGNPIKIIFYVEDYDFEIQDYVIRENIAEISYDDTPNPFYFTLQAGGIIDILDNVKLNVGADLKNSKIIQARLLFPLNNPKQIVYKDENKEVMYTINANYVYDEQNYPTSAVVTSIAADSSENGTLTVSFTYAD